MRNAKQTAVLAGGLFGILALGACGSTSAGTGAAAPASTQSTSAAAATTPATTPATSSSPSAGGSTPTCKVADLKVTDAVDEGGGSAGHHTEYLVFQNTSGSECRLQGYPGVSFVTGDSGKQVGSAFTRTKADTPATVLLPNGHAHATIQLASGGTTPDEDCKPVPVRGYRVFPPDSKASIFVPKSQTACSAAGKGVGQVKPVIPGADGD